MKIHSQCECFPFFRRIGITDIPDGLLNEEWAQRNHSQSLKRLNERGGITIMEALSIIKQRDYMHLQWEKAATIYQHILTGYNIGIKQH